MNQTQKSAKNNLQNYDWRSITTTQIHTESRTINENENSIPPTGHSIITRRTTITNCS